MNKKKEPYFKGKAEKGLAGAGAAAAVANLGYTGRNFYKEVIKKGPDIHNSKVHGALLAGSLAAAGGAHALRRRRLKK
jgi:hypothetical protein